MQEIYLTPAEIQHQHLFKGFKPKKVLMLEHLPYTADELSPEIQAEVCDQYRHWNLEHEWWDCAYDGFIHMMSHEYGIEIENINFDVGCNQGRGIAISGNIYTGEPRVYKLMRDTLRCLPERFKMWELYKSPVIDEFMNWFRGYIEMSGRGFNFSVSFDMPDEDDIEGFNLDATEREYIEQSVEEFIKDKTAQLFTTLEKEYDYLLSDEAIIESLTASEYKFTSQGEMR